VGVGRDTFSTPYGGQHYNNSIKLVQIMDNNQLDKYETFQEWFEANLSESAADIASHGADCGFPNISYTRDCVELFDHFETEIWEMAVTDA
jgi:hypothetical protein